MIKDILSPENHITGKTFANILINNKTAITFINKSSIATMTNNNLTKKINGAFSSKMLPASWRVTFKTYSTEAKQGDRTSFNFIHIYNILILACQQISTACLSQTQYNF